jgi:crotonobetainyl-CoA:carnitine CoA-transferase CaiB-like acyl-CoA transferase
LGANVIKVEPPEWKRSLRVRIARRDESVFLSYNRGKKSIVLDLTLPEGRNVFEELVKLSDVVLSNYPPSVVKKLGLAYETLGRINPRIICCNISGYGLEGNNVERPAYDLAIQAASGIMSVTGEEGNPPVRAGIAIADVKGGIMGAYGILAAYIRRQKEGTGQQVDISMFDNILLNFSYSAMKYYATGEVPGPVGASSSAGKRADYREYETKDGHIVVASGRGEEKWRSFCKAIGKEQVAVNPEFDSYEKRIKVENRMKIEQLFEPVFRTKTSREWVAQLADFHIPCAPVNTLDKVLLEAENQGRGMIVSYPLPSGETGKAIGNPVKVGPTENLNPPPQLGEHTKEILSNKLNYSETEISELAEAKAIFLGK